MKRSGLLVDRLQVSDGFAYALRRAIRAERQRLGLTQAELAGRLGWIQTSVSQLELGTRRIYADEIPDLCRALGVPFGRLLVDAPAEDRDVFGA